MLSLPLSCSTAPVFPRGKLLHMSGAPVFMSGDLGFVAATQEMPFAHLSLEVKETFILCSHMTVRSGKTVLGRITLPEHCMDSKLKQNSNSFWKQKPICLSRNFGLKCRLFGTFKGIYGDNLREWRPLKRHNLSALPRPYCRSPVASRKQLIPLAGTDFCG